MANGDLSAKESKERIPEICNPLVRDPRQDKSLAPRINLFRCFSCCLQVVFLSSSDKKNSPG